MVSRQGRALLCGRPGGPAPGKLVGSIPRCGAEAGWRGNAACAAYRVCQPPGLNGTKTRQIRFGSTAESHRTARLSGSGAVADRTDLLRNPNLGPMRQGFRIPELGIWNLDSRLWTLDSRLWTLDSRLWTLDSRLWNLDSRLWNLESGLSTLES